MLTLCYRNLLLYFRNKSEVFFSLLAALISFILYVAFLKDSVGGDWGKELAHMHFLDLWLIGGTLGITAISTTLAAMSQKIEDQEKNTENDFLLSGISHFQLSFSYVLSASLIGFVMQVVVYVVMYLYFYLVDGLRIGLTKSLLLIALMMLGSLINAIVNAVILLFVQNRNTLSAVSSVIGTVSGFLVGAYIPVGILPQFAQFLVKLTPGAYVSSLYRQSLLNDDLKNLFPIFSKRAIFSEEMGISLKWNHLLNYFQTLAITIVLFVLLLGLLVGIEKIISTRKKQAYS